MSKRIIAIISIVFALISVVMISNASATSNDYADLYVHQDAEFEDSDISLWFDYSTEKNMQSANESNGKESFCVYMAKNEIEDAQFLLCSTTDKENLTATLSGFVDNYGNKLDANIHIALYSDCDSYGVIPDALPPLEAYGNFSLSEGASQAFIIRIKSNMETVAGDYSSVLTIFDNDGKAIKTTTLYVHVWNFELSDDTACATSMNLSTRHTSYVASAFSEPASEVYKKYYDYLLENRICSYYLPYELWKSDAISYMDNPRVTSFQMSCLDGSELSVAQTTRIYNIAFNTEGGENRFEKSYFFSNVVDANTAGQLEALRSYNNNLMSKYSSLQPSYADVPYYLINTYFFDIDYVTSDGTVIDQIAYYEDFLKFWCSKPFAYTKESELNILGSKVMQPLKWNSVYGTFSDRMAEKRANGQKVWWFLSWDINEPYINYYIQTDGVAQRILFWQQYDNGVQGFLNNFSNYWNVPTGDPYTSNITDSSKPNAHGESMLIYPGTKYGLDTPVPSMRLEAMRDGIEDYQMFTMIDEYLGEGTSDQYIDIMTTGMVTYSVSDESYYETRKALGNALEAVYLSATCDHNYISIESENATCQHGGFIKYVCEKCSDSYTEDIEVINHNYVDGKCTMCTATDPDYVAYSLGDVNLDGKVTALDSNMLVKIISGVVTPNDEQSKCADVDANGKVDSKDTNMLQKIVTGVITIS